MAADAGAQAILDLLNQPSDVLNKNTRALMKAQREQVDRPYGVMAQYGIDALAEIRNFYRVLRTQIDAIETVDVASKTSALEALDSLDSAIGSYERSLEFGISKPAIPKAKAAARKGREVKTSLRQAIAGLSQ
jgi:hypothetical protein